MVRPTRRNLLVFLVLALAVVASFYSDAAVLAWLAEGRTNAWKRVAQTCSKLGDWPVLAAFALVAGLVAWWRRDRRWVMIVCAMLLGSLLAGAVVNPVRALAGRARPNARVEPGWHGLRNERGEWITGRHRYSAFPSAHVSVAAGFIAPLVVLGPRAAISAWIVVLLVAWSRVFLGVHHPSDVVVGAVLGRSCGIFISHSAFVRRHLRRVVSLSFRKRPLGPMARESLEPKQHRKTGDRAGLVRHSAQRL